MFWDKVASVYDLFEDIYIRKVYRGTGRTVAGEISKEDDPIK